MHIYGKRHAAQGQREGTRAKKQRVDRHDQTMQPKARYEYHVIEKHLKYQVCLLTVRKTKMLLDPPDKLLDQYRILEGEQPAKSAFVALGCAEKRDIHGA